MPSPEKLAEFVAWCQKHITGDEKGQAQIFLDRLFQSFGQSGCLDVGGTTEFRIRKAPKRIILHRHQRKRNIPRNERTAKSNGREEPNQRPPAR